jgi:deoxyribonuclease V
MKEIDTAVFTALQIQLAQEVFIPPEDEAFPLEEGALLFTLDIQYQEEIAYMALDVQGWRQSSSQIYVARTGVEFEYKPRFFCFREGPPLLKMIERVQQHLGLEPALLLVDGHGIAHPQRLGVASWLGIRGKVPSIGCAKAPLLEYTPPVENQRGSTSLLFREQEAVGVALVTQDRVKPVFVSPGHRISLKQAIAIILELSPKHRISEPLRRADQSARAYAKGQIPSQGIDLGELL